MTTTAAPPSFEAIRSRHRAAALAAAPAHIERLGWPADRLRAHQAERLQGVLAHAVEHSPFHAARLAGIDLGAVTPDDLRALPVMTKTDLMASFDDVVTDRRLRRARVEDHLAATGSTPAYLDGDVLCLASGGSSGVRGIFVLGWDAAIDYFLGMARVPLARVAAMGGPPPGGVPMAMVAAGSGVHATRALTAIFGGEMITPTSIPVTLPLEDIVDRLNDVEPLVLQSYPSVLARLAEEQVAGRLRISPLAVTSTSERLDHAVRARASAAFGVPVADQFGSTEGLVGLSAPGEEAITMASDLAIAELVDAEGDPVPDGVAADRVLVTTLFNPLLPLVRYELTDRMVRLPASPDHGHLRVLVEGRLDEPLRYGDVEVHPLAVRSTLVRTAAVVEYQVRQTRCGIDVDVVTDRPVDTAALAEELAGALAGAGLGGAVVHVAEVDAVARHPETGKVRRFVPLT